MELSLVRRISFGRHSMPNGKGVALCEATMLARVEQAQWSYTGA